MFTNDEIKEIQDFLEKAPADSKVYLGSDSVKYKKRGNWYARYTIVLVVHLAQKHGCKVFSYTEKEQVFDQKINRPTMRLMAEVYKVVELYNALEDTFLEMDTEPEIHLDLNSDSNYVSNHVVKQAIGYVKGVTGLDARIKPDSMIASHCADFGANHQTYYNERKRI